jgi:hypothetical protein
MRRHSIGLALLICLNVSVGGSAFAGETGHDVTKDLDGDSRREWKATAPTTVAVVDDVLEIQFTGSSDGREDAILEACVYRDPGVHVDVSDPDGTGEGAVQSHTTGAVANGYAVNLRSAPWNDLTLGRVVAGATCPLATTYLPRATGEWNRVAIFVSGPTIQVDVDGYTRILYAGLHDPPSEGPTVRTISAGTSRCAHLEQDNVVIEADDAVESSVIGWGLIDARFEE